VRVAVVGAVASMRTPGTHRSTRTT
jgi:hypothetical protein